MKKILLVICLLMLLAMVGCGEKDIGDDDASTSTKTSSEASTEEPVSLPTEMPALDIEPSTDGEIEYPSLPDYMQKPPKVSWDEAADRLSEKVLKRAPSNFHIGMAYVSFLEERYLYIFKGFEVVGGYIATFGWYGVDIHTGEVFDTNAMTKLTPIK